jgi:hypothetical protein
VDNIKFACIALRHRRSLDAILVATMKSEASTPNHRHYRYPDNDNAALKHLPQSKYLFLQLHLNPIFVLFFYTQTLDSVLFFKALFCQGCPSNVVGAPPLHETDNE